METKRGPGKRRKAEFPRPWVGRWTRCSRVRLRHALANSQGSAFSFLRGRKEREKEKQKREMRAEIAATGVAHYANKSTSVHLLVEAGSNRASAVDEQRVKPNLRCSLWRIGADRWRFVSSSRPQWSHQTPYSRSTASSVKSALFPTSCYLSTASEYRKAGKIQ